MQKMVSVDQLGEPFQALGIATCSLMVRIMQLLAKNPAERIGTAQELAKLLEAFCKPAPAPAGETRAPASPSRRT